MGGNKYEGRELVWREGGRERVWREGESGKETSLLVLDIRHQVSLLPRGYLDTGGVGGTQ